ncbi:MAG: nucleotidyl transferase AbiEii/AbiGii toxin family protein [Bacteroidia bacterium]|jgi:predicted nucleotidyltransferase component of viral defense system|nr:nucleotidyl transferase AbiEii/AbiGii toxin family protein [Bacteroidia bacterium]
MNTNLETIERIKRIALTALLTDDLLVRKLVLKGGNALNIAYDLSNRGSMDIDFSMEDDFTEEEKQYLKKEIATLLQAEFKANRFHVFDIRFTERPRHIGDEIKHFWGGYSVEFKVCPLSEAQNDIEKLRREAIPLTNSGLRTFSIDISKYEFIGQKRAKEIDGTVLYVYSPEMLVLEKLRALCQQTEEYRALVPISIKSRARDFFDIHTLVTHFNLDFNTDENIALARNIFEIKKVELRFIRYLNKYKEHHRQSWQIVKDTILSEDQAKDFDYYFEFVLTKFTHLGRL